jgi:hypothetical protein
MRFALFADSALFSALFPCPRGHTEDSFSRFVLKQSCVPIVFGTRNAQRRALPNHHHERAAVYSSSVKLARDGYASRKEPGRMALPRADHDRDNGGPENHQRPKHDKRGQPGAAMQADQDVLGRSPEGIRSTFEKTDLGQVRGPPGSRCGIRASLNEDTGRSGRRLRPLRPCRLPAANQDLAVNGRNQSVRGIVPTKRKPFDVNARPCSLTRNLPPRGSCRRSAARNLANAPLVGG